MTANADLKFKWNESEAEKSVSQMNKNIEKDRTQSAIVRFTRYLAVESMSVDSETNQTEQNGAVRYYCSSNALIQRCMPTKILAKASFNRSSHFFDQKITRNKNVMFRSCWDDLTKMWTNNQYRYIAVKGWIAVLCIQQCSCHWYAIFISYSQNRPNHRPGEDIKILEQVCIYREKFLNIIEYSKIYLYWELDAYYTLQTALTSSHSLYGHLTSLPSMLDHNHAALDRFSLTIFMCGSMNISEPGQTNRAQLVISAA